jgi:hypothetical protein
MKGALVARAELLELPSSSPPEVLYEDSSFLCIKMHRIQFSFFFQLRTTEIALLSNDGIVLFVMV